MNENENMGMSYPEDMEKAMAVLDFMPPEVKGGVVKTFFSFICMGAI